MNLSPVKKRTQLPVNWASTGAPISIDAFDVNFSAWPWPQWRLMGDETGIKKGDNVPSKIERSAAWWKAAAFTRLIPALGRSGIDQAILWLNRWRWPKIAYSPHGGEIRQ